MSDPTPGIVNTVSMMAAPPSKAEKLSAMAASMGIMALRSACLNNTVRSATPLERAVRM